MSDMGTTATSICFTITRQESRITDVQTDSPEINHFLDMIKVSRAYNTWISYAHDLSTFFGVILCRVLEPSGTATGEDGEMVFDATGLALGGVVRARFRFTIFRGDDGMAMARAQEIMSLPFVVPPKETLESEHRHTFRDLNRSFLAPTW